MDRYISIIGISLDSQVYSLHSILSLMQSLIRAVQWCLEIKYSRPVNLLSANKNQGDYSSVIIVLAAYECRQI